MQGSELPQSLAGRYRVIRLIGRGGMGAVYEVEHLHTGQHLALKVLATPGGMASTEAVERFKREARAPSQLKTDHVVRVTDADVASELGGAPILVMELLEGADLEQVVRDRTPSPTEVLEWLRQVARGLAKAHELGIVHRDLKPENLFLTQREDGTPLVKILDFGVAKILSDGHKTQSGQLLGTPLYMAPEQADSAAVVTPQTDLFALGLIAYRFLVGKVYWHDGSIRQVLSQILVGPMEAPSARGAKLGAGFDSWFERACDRDPTKRFHSAREQIEALAEALGAPRVLYTSEPPSHEPRLSQRESATTISAPATAVSMRRSLYRAKAGWVSVAAVVLVGGGLLWLRSGPPAEPITVEAGAPAVVAPASGGAGPASTAASSSGSPAPSAAPSAEPLASAPASSRPAAAPPRPPLSPRSTPSAPQPPTGAPSLPPSSNPTAPNPAKRTPLDDQF
jgi:eukaryotic-like serine/threonine-protein kinase